MSPLENLSDLERGLVLWRTSREDYNHSSLQGKAINKSGKENRVSLLQGKAYENITSKMGEGSFGHGGGTGRGFKQYNFLLSCLTDGGILLMRSA